MHSLLRLVASQPQLRVDPAEAYAERVFLQTLAPARPPVGRLAAP